MLDHPRRHGDLEDVHLRALAGEFDGIFDEEAKA